MHAMNFHNETKSELERMLSIEADFGRAKGSLDALLSDSAVPSELAPALFTHFLVSYARAFTTGRRKGLNENIFVDCALVVIHKEVIKLRNQHISHPVSDHENCEVLAAVPDLNRSDAVGLEARYWFFLVDPPEKLKSYRRVLEFALGYASAGVERLGNQLAVEVLGEGNTWKSAQRAFWSVFSPNDIYGPGAEETMAAQRNKKFT